MGYHFQDEVAKSLSLCLEHLVWLALSFVLREASCPVINYAIDSQPLQEMDISSQQPARI